MHTLLAVAVLSLGAAELPPPPPPAELLPEYLPLFLDAGLTTPAQPALAPATQAGGRSDMVNYSGVRVAFEIGRREYTDSAWQGTGDATAIGFTFTQEMPGWVVGWDAGVFWTNEKGNYNALEVRSHTGEGYAGVMKSFHLIRNRLRLELGAGASLQYLYANADNLSFDDDWTAAGYARAALALRVGGTALVGLGYRGAWGGSARIYGSDLDTDYNQVTFMLGTAF